MTGSKALKTSEAAQTWDSTQAEPARNRDLVSLLDLGPLALVPTQADADCNATSPSLPFDGVSFYSHQSMKYIKAISKYMLAIFMIGAGTMHFVAPGVFLKIVPPYLPFHEGLVLASGACEVLLGILLLVPRCSHLAAWGIIALLIAVFPANVHLYQNQEILPASPALHLLRLPLQGAFILWAYWHTSRASQVTRRQL